jgi:hypothetical protein
MENPIYKSNVNFTLDSTGSPLDFKSDGGINEKKDIKNESR